VSARTSLHVPYQQVGVKEVSGSEVEHKAAPAVGGTQDALNRPTSRLGMRQASSILPVLPYVLGNICVVSDTAVAGADEVHTFSAAVRDDHATSNVLKPAVWPEEITGAVRLNLTVHVAAVAPNVSTIDGEAPAANMNEKATSSTPPSSLEPSLMAAPAQS